MNTSRADWWFAALDHRRIGHGEHAWISEVSAVRLERDVFWVSLAPADDPASSIILQIPSDSQLDDVLKALEDDTSRAG